MTTELTESSFSSSPLEDKSNNLQEEKEEEEKAEANKEKANKKQKQTRVSRNQEEMTGNDNKSPRKRGRPPKASTMKKTPPPSNNNNKKIDNSSTRSSNTPTASSADGDDNGDGDGDNASSIIPETEEIGNSSSLLTVRRSSRLPSKQQNEKDSFPASSPAPDLPSEVEGREESDEKINGRKRKFGVLEQSDEMTLRDRMTLYVQKDGYNPLNSEEMRKLFEEADVVNNPYIQKHLFKAPVISIEEFEEFMQRKNIEDDITTEEEEKEIMLVATARGYFRMQAQEQVASVKRMRKIYKQHVIEQKKLEEAQYRAELEVRQQLLQEEEQRKEALLVERVKEEEEKKKQQEREKRKRFISIY